MDEELPANDMPHDDVVIFVAEGIVCERLGVSIDDAVVALADMAVTGNGTLVETARHVLAGEIDPGSYTQTRPEAEGTRADPNRG